jgi:tripartite-type tricarboxylate transporter receptor subunit TctC
MFVRHDAQAPDLEGLRKREVVIGATGTGSYQFVVPTLLNQHQQTKLKVVTGYPGASELILAVERGEIQGMLGSVAGVLEVRPDWMNGKGIAAAVIQIGETPDPSIPNVPLLTTLASSEQERALYRFISADNVLGRSLVTSPHTPAEAIVALRIGFAAMIKDPEFLKIAEDRKLPMVSANHEALKNLIDSIMRTPPDVLLMAKKIMKPE